MLRPHPRLLVPGLALTALACGSSSDGRDGDGGTYAERPPSFAVVEEGTGEPNSQPLWPLGRGSANDRTRVLNEREHQGRRLVAVMTEGKPNVINWSWYSYYSESDAGLLLHGTSRYGLTERPALVVPKTVRDGMEWTTDPGRGGPSDAGRALRCTAKKSFPDVAQTFLPSATAWSIDCRDGYRYAWAEILGEGVGPLPSHTLDLREAPFEAEPPSDRTPLEALNGGAPLFEDIFPHRIGAIAVPGDQGALRIVVDGEGFEYALGGVVNLEGGGTAVTNYLPAPARQCVFLDGETFDDPDSDVDVDCPDPLGAAIGGDGKLRSIPIGQYCIEGGATCSSYRFLAIRGDTRGAEVLARSDQLYSARYYDGTEEYPWFRIEDAVPVGHKLGGLGLINDGGAYSLLFGEKSSAGETLVVPDRLGDELFVGRWTDRWDGAHPALVPGALSAHVSGSGRDVLEVTPEGRISRLIAEDGTLRLSRVADVAAPEGHVVVGAVDRGDTLVVFTLTGYEGLDAQIVLDPPGSEPPSHIDPDIEPTLGQIHAWAAHPAEGPEDPAAPPVERLPVYMQGETRDARICTHDPWTSPPEGFSLGGVPAGGGLVTSQHCALVLRDPGNPTPLDITGRLVAEPHAGSGVLPGIGATRQGRRATEPDVTWPRIESAGEVAPLEGGGLVNGTSPFWIWGPAGVLENRAEGAEGGAALPDASGHGLWMLLPETVECQASVGCARWALWGRTRQTFTVTDPSPLPAGVPVQSSTTGVAGGGVLTPHYLLRPDGAAHFYAVPAPPLGSRWEPGGALSDGTVCGGFEENVVENGFSTVVQTTLCVAPDGATRTLSTAVWPPYHVAGNVFYAVTSANITVRLDPGALTVTPVDYAGIPGVSSVGPSVPPAFVHDARGELFATVPGPPTTGQSLPVLLRFTSRGVEGLPLPTPPDQSFSSNRLLVDEAAFLFVGPPGGANGTFRVAR